MSHSAWRAQIARGRFRGAVARLAACLLVALLAPLANVRVALGQDAVSRISSPQSGSTVRDVVVVTGTATHPSFSFYKVELSLEPGGTWFVIGDTHANQVKDGALLQWDTRTVPDGSYSLRLLVVDATGNYIESVVRQVVVANAGAAPTETTTPTPTGTLTGTPATGTPTVTPPSGTPEPTATVSIILPSVDTATPIAVGTRVAVAVPTGEATASEDTSTGTAIREMLSGIAGEMLDALGIHIDTQSLGSAGVRGAVLAFGAFLAIGVLALVRAVLVGLFHLIFRR